MLSRVAAGLVAGALATVSPAKAEIIALTAELSAQAEVPTNPSTARGTADVTVDTSARQIAWTIRFAGLSAPLRAAHFHGPATTAGNASILLPITQGGGESPLTGFGQLTAEQMADVIAGRWYINLHTSTYPGGEIRGQVVRK